MKKSTVLATLVLHRAMAWYQNNLDTGHIPGFKQWKGAHADEKKLHAACAALAKAERK